MKDLLFNVGCPEASNGAIMGINWEEGWASADEGLVDVLHDNLRFTDGLTVVDQYRNRLVHRVRAEEQLALVAEILLDALVAKTLEVESKLHPCDERARPLPDQLHVVVSSGHLLLWKLLQWSCSYACS